MNILARIINTSKELVEKIEFEEEKELNYLNGLVRDKIGDELFEEYEVVNNAYTVEVQIKAYEQGFKDAFKLFKELEL